MGCSEWIPGEEIHSEQPTKGGAGVVSKGPSLQSDRARMGTCHLQPRQCLSQRERREQREGSWERGRVELNALHSFIQKNLHLLSLRRRKFQFRV